MTATIVHLVEYIKHPERSFEPLADHLQQQRELTVTSEQIDQFFQAHAFKKTSPTPTSGS